MNAQVPIRTPGSPEADQLDQLLDQRPTLDQRLRFIDLTFECVAQARAENVASEGPIYPSPFQDEGPSERGKAIGARACELRFAAMVQEGLPYSLLTRGELGRLSKAHKQFNRSGI